MTDSGGIGFWGQDRQGEAGMVAPPRTVSARVKRPGVLMHLGIAHPDLRVQSPKKKGGAKAVKNKLSRVQLTVTDSLKNTREN